MNNKFFPRLHSLLPLTLVLVLMACTAAPTVTVAPATPISPTLSPTTAPTAAPTKQSGTAIRDVQGAGHISPFNGKEVKNVQGIVTAIRTDGFYMQDPLPDNDDATSEGLFIFTRTLPTVKVGDLVNVDGEVKEYYSRDSSLGDLSITEILRPTVKVISSGNKLPAPIIIGKGGRVPPNKIIKSEKGDADQTKFSPQTDGLDFFESLESMLVQVNDAVAVAATNRFGEIAVVGDRGEFATKLSSRGALPITADDFNPERVFLDDTLMPTPVVYTGDHFTRPVIGIMDYSFGNYKLQITQEALFAEGSLAPEATTKQKENQISIVTFNVENLSATSDAEKFKNLAQIIVTNLQSPDIIGIEEIQDNNGTVNDGLVDASETYKILIKAIKDAGGPTYDFRDIPPENNRDGGAGGGNIRVGFMFRSDRGVKFVDRAGGTATKPVTPVKGATGVELSFSPGRVVPFEAAWQASRKPLAGEFTYNGHKLIVVVNHFVAKLGDDSAMGRRQPLRVPSESLRLEQAKLLADFVKSVLTLDPTANIVVLGDLNDFQFSPPVLKLKEVGLTDLFDLLPANEQYDYVFDGNAQVLDHIMLSSNLMKIASPEFKPLHINAEFAVRASDHDPLIAKLTFLPK